MTMQREQGVAIRGAQYGDRNEQRNYFGHVTQHLFGGSFPASVTVP
jgi:hypothetical protein